MLGTIEGQVLKSEAKDETKVATTRMICAERHDCQYTGTSPLEKSESWYSSHVLNICNHDSLALSRGPLLCGDM